MYKTIFKVFFLLLLIVSVVSTYKVFKLNDRLNYAYEENKNLRWENAVAYSNGYEKAKDEWEEHDCWDSGYEIGHESGYELGYKDGYEDGYEDGYDYGYQDGYDDCESEYEY